MNVAPWETLESCWVNAAPARWHIPADERKEFFLYEVKFELRDLESCDEKNDPLLSCELIVNGLVVDAIIKSGDIHYLRLKRADFSAYLKLFFGKKTIRGQRSLHKRSSNPNKSVLDISHVPLSGSNRKQRRYRGKSHGLTHLGSMRYLRNGGGFPPPQTAGGTTKLPRD